MPAAYRFSPRNQAMVLRYLIAKARGRPMTIKALSRRYGLSQAWVGQILDRWLCRVTMDPHSEFMWSPAMEWVRTPARRRFWANFRDRDTARAFLRALWVAGRIARPAGDECAA